MAFSGSSVPTPVGFSEGLAPSHDKVEMKPRSTYKKDKTFPPARKKKTPSMEKPNVFHGVPPDHPQILI